jgi:hypothetical protein
VTLAGPLARTSAAMLAAELAAELALCSCSAVAEARASASARRLAREAATLVTALTAEEVASAEVARSFRARCSSEVLVEEELLLLQRVTHLRLLLVDCLVCLVLCTTIWLSLV